MANLSRIAAAKDSITSGKRLGPYEILAPISAGGMGEVYRARDPRLGRDWPRLLGEKPARFEDYRSRSGIWCGAVNASEGYTFVNRLSVE